MLKRKRVCSKKKKAYCSPKEKVEKLEVYAYY